MGWLNQTLGGLLSQSASINQSVSANRAALGVSEARAQQLQAKTETYAAALRAKTAADEAYRASVLALEAAKAELETDLSELNQFVRHQPQVSPELLVSVGFPIYKRQTIGRPEPVLALRARLIGENQVALRWNPGSNPRSAIYHVEIQVGEGAWQWVGSSAGVKFTLTLDRPGEPTLVRVRTQRGTRISEPSVAVSLWSSRDRSAPDHALAA